ncbi:MAG TPA: LeuA family protein [Candidatus Krumholzibacteria bacterium]|nr:LeuA family protein [Candidatus Krumholzibacteria bacterium]
MTGHNQDNIIHDWNPQPVAPPYPLKLNDETLRDGLQSPSVFNPSIPEKLEILHFMEDLGLYSAAIGLPAAGPHAFNDVLAIAGEIARARMKLYPYCAARTHQNDIVPIVDIQQKTGIKIQAALFIFSSPIRQIAEDWTVDRLLKVSEAAIEFAHKNDVPVMYVTEDTTRSRPETLQRLYQLAIDMNVERLCISDTVGHATPEGAAAVVGFIRAMVTKSGKNIGVDWHGHRDRDLAVANSVAAFYAGADRIHGSMLGIGERVGNTPLDTLMVNFKLMGAWGQDLRRLPAYARKVAEACRVPLPDNYPVLGRDAFRTQTGVHADAIVKAYKKGDAWLANRIYSGVPADEVGLEQIIEVGPMSGKSNVRYWLESRSIAATDTLVDRIFERAKQVDHILTDGEIQEIIRG